MPCIIGPRSLQAHGEKLNLSLFDGKTLAGLEQGNEVLLIKEAILAA